MDLEKIEQLMQLMRNYGVKDLSVTSGTDEIKLTQINAHTQSIHPNDITSNSSYISGHTTTDNPAQEENSKSVTKLLSPFVGTVYLSPSPGAEPFVTIGSKIKKGDTLCIVEAMKLMNEIEAEVSGTITKIMISNEQPVEYNQVLFLVEPT